MFTAAFAKGAVERAIKTFAQALVAFVGADYAGLLDVPWQDAASVAALAALVSFLTSVGNPDFVAGRTPELAQVEYVDLSTPEDAAAVEEDTEVIVDDDTDSEPVGSETFDEPN